MWICGEWLRITKEGGDVTKDWIDMNGLVIKDGDDVTKDGLHVTKNGFRVTKDVRVLAKTGSRDNNAGLRVTRDGCV